MPFLLSQCLSGICYNKVWSILFANVSSDNNFHLLLLFSCCRLVFRCKMKGISLLVSELEIPVKLSLESSSNALALSVYLTKPHSLMKSICPFSLVYRCSILLMDIFYFLKMGSLKLLQTGIGRAHILQTNVLPSYRLLLCDNLIQ